MRKYVQIAIVLIGLVAIWHSLQREQYASFTWEIQEVGVMPSMTDQRVPINSISLRSGRTSVTYPLPGNYGGRCIVADGSGELEPGEITAVICGLGSEGVELGVFDDRDGIVIKKIGRVKMGDPYLFGIRDPLRAETLLQLNSEG